MRKIIVDNVRLPLELDIALTCSKTEEIELTDDWVIVKKDNLCNEEVPYYVSEGLDGRQY